MLENEYEHEYDSDYEEPRWLSDLMFTVQWLSLISTYAIFIMGIIIIDYVRPFEFDLAELSIVSFLMSALAGILTLLVRVFHTKTDRQRKFVAAVMYGCVGITVLGCVSGILTFVGFILL